jgi:signal transduction histidine kinase
MSRRDVVIRAVLAAVVAGAGLAATVVLAWSADMTVRDSLHLLTIAAVPAALAGMVAAASLVLLRRAPIAVQAAVVTVSTVGAVGLGAYVAAESMFLNAHDLTVLGVILAASATVGVLVALAIGLQVERATRALRAATVRMAEGDLATPVRPAGTAELGALSRDLGEMSRRLQEARRRERAVEESRRELVAWISHDLRTPLSAIRAVAEALEDEVLVAPEEVAAAYATLRAEADRLAGMVDDLFELSRINAGALRLELDRAALADLVSEALGAAAFAARAKGVRLHGAMEGDGAEVRVDTREMSRVLRNLVDNAIRHTPADGSVWVEGGFRDDRAYVSVADGCGGIADDDLDRVFDVAFRGEAARTPSTTSGAGLGLAIAQGIARAHRGEISVRNDGPGCRFTLTLPLSPPVAELRPGSSAEAREHPRPPAAATR